jgi:DUF4097 and DUF4098 domain-containing protein YvlB
MKHPAMKRLSPVTLSLVALAACVFAAPRASADEWSKTYNISGKPEVRIETSDANIRVSTWDRNTIEARVLTTRYKIGEDGIRIEEHQNGDSVEIEVRFPHHGFRVDWGQHRVDIVIQMPRQGKVDLRTDDGNIDVGSFKGEMDLRSGDGSETLDGVDGKLRAATGDGHIKANGRFDELELKTGDGHLDVHAATGSSLAAGWRLETGDGNVSVTLPGDLAANVDLHTGDGHIDLAMPVTTEGEQREGEVRGKLNGGGSLLTIRTGDGSIRLGKS